MKQYLFFATEGFMFDPYHKEISNMQILGDDVVEAFGNFKCDQSYIQEFGFKEAMAVQYIGDMIRHLEL